MGGPLWVMFGSVLGFVTGLWFIWVGRKSERLRDPSLVQAYVVGWGCAIMSVYFFISSFHQLSDPLHSVIRP